MCDGIAEEIIDALCAMTGLRVAARSSSFQFKGKAADVGVMAGARSFDVAGGKRSQGPGPDTSQRASREQ
jgi:TolB-like protein